MQNKHQTFFSFFGGPTYGEGGPLVGPNAQLFPKMHFEGPPKPVPLHLHPPRGFYSKGAYQRLVTNGKRAQRLPLFCGTYPFSDNNSYVLFWVMSRSGPGIATVILGKTLPKWVEPPENVHRNMTFSFRMTSIKSTLIAEINKKKSQISL